jgi:hypothetical protein
MRDYQATKLNRQGLAPATTRSTVPPRGLLEISRIGVRQLKLTPRQIVQRSLICLWKMSHLMCR